MIRSIYNAEHYSWGGNCDGWRLLNSDHLSVIRESMQPGTSEQLHYHLYAQQLFYILAGTATFIVEEETLVVHAGESIHIAKGLKHRILNAEEAELGFILISEPNAQNDRVNL